MKRVRMHKKTALVMILVLVLSLCSLSGTYADDEDEGDLQEQLDQAQENAEQAKSELEGVMAKIDTLQSDIEDRKTEIESTQTEIAELQTRISSQEEAIAAKQDELSDQEDGLGKRLRTMYKSGTVGFLDIILGSRNISELLSNVSMVQRIFKNDQKTLDELKTECDALKRAKEELDQAKAELEDRQEVLATQQSELEKQNGELESEASVIREKIAEFNEQAERLSQEIYERQQANQAANPDFVYAEEEMEQGGGLLGWPVSGPITSEYGPRPNLYGDFHPGIDIGVPTGTPVHAAASGYVIVSGWYGGYGYGVVIDHGMMSSGISLSTVYGHNSSLLVSVGQFVNKGDVIAYSGSTGWSTGPHVHFEVREDGQHTNPRNYLG